MDVKTLAKLSKARVQISESGLKKSGKNDFAHYQYYELKDFLPTVMKVCAEVGLCPIVSFGTERSILTVYDTELDGSFVQFSCPSISACVKGAADIQNEGARQTYLKRYLYMTAFEIAETDTVEVDAQIVDQAAGEDMHRADLLNELKQYGLTLEKLTAYKGPLAGIPTEYLEKQLAKRKQDAEARKEAETKKEKPAPELTTTQEANV